MEKIEITKDTPVIIYGAGGLGKFWAEVLMNMGYSIVAFLDRKAESLENVWDIPVLLPDSDKIEDTIKKKCIVVITILNVYLHDEIACKLNEYGYENILFKHNVLGEKDEATITLNRIYDDLWLKENFLEVSLPKFKSLSWENNKGSIIKKETGYTVAYVPTEALFTGGIHFHKHDIKRKVLPNRIKKKIYQNLMYYSKPYIIFSAMDENIKDIEWDNFCNFYADMIKAENAKDKIDESEWCRHFEDKYRLYQIMSNNLMIYPSYFVENPASVIMTQEGKLGLLDGEHRAAFLLTKKIYKIPCRLRNEDWDKYYNKEKVERIRDYILRETTDVIYYPIAHSAFIDYLAKEDMIARKIVLSINRYLVAKDISIKEEAILDVGSRNGYFAQLYAHMGAKVVAFEDEKRYLELFVLENELLKIKSINIQKSCMIDCLEKHKNDVLFIHHHIVDEYRNKIIHYLEKFKGIVFFETTEMNWIADIQERFEIERLMHICMGSKMLDVWVYNGRESSNV